MAVTFGNPSAFNVGLKAKSTSVQLASVVTVREAKRAREV
jgi:hypothetical protein